MRFWSLRRSRKGNVPRKVKLDRCNPISQVVNGGQNSPLLNLPCEIRLQILRSIFSQHIIHFFITRTEEGAQFGWPQGRVKSTKPQIRSKWCSLDCSYRFNDTHVLDDLGQGQHHLKLAPGNAIEILLSCRQIYREAIELVYAENIFDFVDLLSFGDFTAQFRSAVNRIRYLQTRHKVPTLGYYARFSPPAGLRAAIGVSWEGPVVFLDFVSARMPQLRGLKLLFERCWMTSEYEAEYSRRHEEWIRLISQLELCQGVVCQSFGHDV
jgi:hypothetical protein